MSNRERMRFAEGRLVLRDVTRRDIPKLFRFQSDRESNRMAGFVPRTKAAFEAHWARILADDSIEKKAILIGGSVVGYLVCFERADKREVGYWIGRRFWGRGFATKALAAFLKKFARRPLYARVAKDNIGSLRVCEKCGFKVVAQDQFSNAAGQEIPEFVLELPR